MEEFNEQETVVEADVDEVEEETPEPTAQIDWEKRARSLEEKAIAQRERTKMLKADIEKLKRAAAPKEAPVQKTTTGELDETAMLLLEVKGIKVDDQDEMNLVNEYREAGKSVKALITNKIFQAELKALREEKAVQNAMPSSNKRSGTGPADINSLITKFEATGQLPDDFDLRSQVVNAMEARTSVQRAPWRR